MTGWWDDIDDDRSRDAEKAKRLVNVLSKMPGPREAKLRWLEVQMPLLEAEAGKQFDPKTEPREFGAAMCSVAIRFWRGKLLRMGKPRMNWDRERPQEMGPRGSGFSDLCDVIPLKKRQEEKPA